VEAAGAAETLPALDTEITRGHEVPSRDAS
jgi:hypothetical protein